MHEFVDEHSVPSKSKDFDETLSLDLPSYELLGTALRRLVRGRRADEPLFTFSMTELAESMKETALLIGVRYPVFPCQLRHTGASTDFATGDRTLLGIRWRGRWIAEKSARRYEKGLQSTRLLVCLLILMCW